MPSSKAPILLTGVNGQVGGDLLPLLKPFGEVVAPTTSPMAMRCERMCVACSRAGS
jgi:dTDP-4-dehydrorhamnose reductase